MEEKRNEFLTALNEAFKAVSLKDLKCLQNLIEATQRDPRTGDLISGRGLNDKPFWYLRLLVFFAEKGSGTFDYSNLERELFIEDRKEGGNYFNYFRITEFLSWAARVGIFDIKHGPARRPGSAEPETVTVDVSPLNWRWGFDLQEVTGE